MSDPHAVSPFVMASALTLAVYSLAVLWGYAPVGYVQRGDTRKPRYIWNWYARGKRLSFLAASVGLGILLTRWAMEPGDWPLGLLLGLAVIELGPSAVAAARVAIRAAGRRFGGGDK